jgi:hypothetical protein
MTTALERLRQTLANESKQAFGSFVNSSTHESERFHTLARGCVEKGKEVTDFLKNKETSPRPAPLAPSHTPGEGTDKTDKTSQATCARCGEVVTRHNGFRNWFGEPVHTSGRCTRSMSVGDNGYQCDES